jgi:hypothetical protein
VRTQVDRRDDCAVELDLPIRREYLAKHEVTGAGAGVREYVLPLQATTLGKLRRVCQRRSA